MSCDGSSSRLLEFEHKVWSPSRSASTRRLEPSSANIGATEEVVEMRDGQKRKSDAILPGYVPADGDG